MTLRNDEQSILYLHSHEHKSKSISHLKSFSFARTLSIEVKKGPYIIEIRIPARDDPDPTPKVPEPTLSLKYISYL